MHSPGSVCHSIAIRKQGDQTSYYHRTILLHLESEDGKILEHWHFVLFKRKWLGKDMWFYLFIYLFLYFDTADQFQSLAYTKQALYQ